MSPPRDKLWDPDDRQAVEDYIAYLLQQLHLRDWGVDLMKGEADDDAQATIYPAYGQRTAELYLGHDVREWDPDRLRRVLIHELLHLHAAGYQHHCSSGALKTLLGRPTFEAWHSAFCQLNENSIDAIARVIASLLEAFTWPEGKRPS